MRAAFCEITPEEECIRLNLIVGVEKDGGVISHIEARYARRVGSHPQYGDGMLAAVTCLPHG